MALPFIKEEIFSQQKAKCLSGIDLSRKGSVDAPVEDLVKLINAQKDLFTTSSCSGRIIIVENTNKDGELQKEGCQWLYVTHSDANIEEAKNSLIDSKGSAVFKFEPMVMHIQVRLLSDAQRLHSVAVASGFRNSGISIGGSGKIILAIRSTHSLEVPLSCNGQVLVSDAYIEHLVECGNKKMQENMSRINRFFQNLKAMIASPKEQITLLKKSRKDCKIIKSMSDDPKVSSYKEHNLTSTVKIKPTSEEDVDISEDCFTSLFDIT